MRVNSTFAKRTPLLGTCASLLVMLLGCSSGTPRSLADARATYQRAAAGPASQRTPAQLHVAHTALVAAEQTYDDEGDSPNARDRAYVALRKAELAEIQAAIALDDEREANARRRLELTQRNNQVATEKDLEQTRAQLQAEQQRRKEAERAAADALSKLSSVASVKQEPRGVVITLSGAVIFASNKADLLPTAKAKLNQVAEALKKSEPNTRFEVDGYTDSRGPAQLNQDLSQRRAEAVRTYLVSQGVADDRITAQGLGPSNPVADNSTAEGRANNRRVEIIVKSENKSDNAQPAGEETSKQQPTGTGTRTGLQTSAGPSQNQGVSGQAAERTTGQAVAR